MRLRLLLPIDGTIVAYARGDGRINHSGEYISDAAVVTIRSFE